MNKQTGVPIGLALLAAAAAVGLPAVPQPLEYHQFADRRRMLGIDNFLDVTSNFGFLFAGIAGLAILLGGRTQFEQRVERWPWIVFFVGMVLTMAGSCFYHLGPNHESLFWDRLAMTIAFMGLVSAQIVDRIDVRAGLLLLAPMVLIGMATAVYWIVSERQGAGNVLPYALLQGFAVFVLLLMAVLNPSRYTRANDLYTIFGWYVLAKVLEHFDAEVLALTQFVSGHTLKHLAAAAAGFVACNMLIKRRLLAPTVLASMPNVGADADFERLIPTSQAPRAFD